MVDNEFARVWEGVISRTTGPLKFRFILQPAMAIFLAVRGGLKDSREGKPAFFWALFVDSGHRRELLQDAWKSIGRLFLLALVLDCVYQIIVLHWVHPFEAIVVATFLAIIPYLLVRGPVNRVVGARKAHVHPLAPKTHHQ
jgi:hypothetical protein